MLVVDEIRPRLKGFQGLVKRMAADAGVDLPAVVTAVGVVVAAALDLADLSADQAAELHQRTHVRPPVAGDSGGRTKPELARSSTS